MNLKTISSDLGSVLTVTCFVIGAIRPVMHTINNYLVNYCKANLSREQFAQLVHISGSPGFRRIEFVVHMLLSMQPSVLLGALQISAMGNTPEAVHVPAYLREPALDRNEEAMPLVPTAADSHPPQSMNPPHNL